MKDPIGAFERIKKNLIRYVQTAFSTRFSSLEDERARLLEDSTPNGGAFTIEPYVEPRPQYVNDPQLRDLRITELPGFSDGEIREFADFVGQGLIGPDIKLYSHQIQMLSKALERKKAVITSGTGS